MRLILIRHGESVGNVDESAFCRIPDHTMDLTPTGVLQSQQAGARLRNLLGAQRIDVFVSPYRRTWQTLEHLQLGERVSRVREEPRLREQDWGNLQDLSNQIRQRRERDAFGHFFYRLASGESGADVYDRLTGFLTGLTSPWAEAAYEQGTVLLVTHGLAMRLACMALMGWTVAEFEALSNPPNGDYRILTRQTADGRATGGGLLGLGPKWVLDRPFDRWK